MKAGCLKYAACQVLSVCDRLQRPKALIRQHA